jgi:hypothetical protein
VAELGKLGAMTVRLRVAATVAVAAIFVGAWFGLEGAATQSRQSARRVIALSNTAGNILPDLSQVPAGTGGQARQYTALVKEANNRLTPAGPVYDPPLWARWNLKVRQYEAVTNTPGFKLAFSEAQSALDRARQTLLHEALVMEALDNVLDYPATTDMASDDPNALTPSAKAALAGLAAAGAKIGSLKSSSDPTLAEVITQLTAARQSLNDLLNVVGTPGQTQAKAQAVSALLNAQQVILANRNSYTLDQNQLLEKQVAAADHDLRAYTDQLSGI